MVSQFFRFILVRMGTTMRRSRLKQFGGISDGLTIGAIYIFLICILLIILLPVMNIVSSAFSSPSAIVRGRVNLLPVEFTLLGFRAALTHSLIVSGFMNSIIYTVLGTLMNLSLTLCVAYPLSRDDLVGKRIIIAFFTITMFISGGIVPTFLLMNSLGLLDTRAAMIVPAGVSVFNMIIARTFMRTSIPKDLLGAAEIDGCSDFGIFIKIVLPLSKPLIAVLTLLFAVGHWNAFFGGLMFLRNSDLFPLQLVLRQILILNQIDITQMDVTLLRDLWDRQYFAELIQYSSIVISTVPIMILYPFIQKYFIKGVMLGSIKG